MRPRPAGPPSLTQRPPASSLCLPGDNEAAAAERVVVLEAQLRVVGARLAEREGAMRLAEAKLAVRRSELKQLHVPMPAEEPRPAFDDEAGTGAGGGRAGADGERGLHELEVPPDGAEAAPEAVVGQDTERTQTATSPTSRPRSAHWSRGGK